MNMIDSAAQTNHTRSKQTELNTEHVVPLLTNSTQSVSTSHHQLRAACQEYENSHTIPPGFASSFLPAVNTDFLDCDSSHARPSSSDNTLAQATCLESQPLLPVLEDWEDIWRRFIVDPEQDQDIALQTTKMSNAVPTDSNASEFLNSFDFGDASSTTHAPAEAFEAINQSDTDCSATLANAALLDDPAIHESLSGILQQMEELISNRSPCSNSQTEPAIPILAGELGLATSPSLTPPSTLPAFSHANVSRRPSRTSSFMSNVTNERLLAQRRKKRRKSSFSATPEAFTSCKNRVRALRRQNSLSTSGAQSAIPRLPAAVPPRMVRHPMMPTRAVPYNPLLARPLPPSMPNHLPIFALFVAPSPLSTPFPIFQNNAYVSPVVPLTNVPATSASASAPSSEQTIPSTHTPASCVVLRDAKGKNVFKCSDETCGKECKTRGDLKRHLMSRKHQPPLHRCHGCGRVFQREDPLRRHRRSHPQCSAAVASGGGGNGGGHHDDDPAGAYTDQYANGIPSMDMSGMPMRVHMFAPYQRVGVYRAS